MARKAVILVREGQVLLIDSASTNAAIATALPERMGLTAITNAPGAGMDLFDREGFDILLLGGRVNAHIGRPVGAQTLQELQPIRADLCFPGDCSLDADHELWGVHSEESLWKRAMIEVGKQTAVVPTSDKLGKVATHQVANVIEVQRLVVGHGIGRRVRVALTRKGVSVLRTEPIGH